MATETTQKETAQLLRQAAKLELKTLSSTLAMEHCCIAIYILL